MKKINQNGLSTVFHYGPNGELLWERDQAGNTKLYVWLNGRPLARIDQGQIYSYHVDHLGTPQAMTDSTGALVWKADYEPFGKATVKPVSTIENNLRLPGQYYDRETGLHYNYFRDYEPTTGRYIEADPIGLEGGMNLYGYAGANPLKFTDATGLDYWIEGTAKGEGGLGFHQSICVGQYDSPNRTCISFGVDDPNQCESMRRCKGKVYYDDSAPGSIVFGRYRKTNADQDRRIVEFFESLIGKEAPYDLVNNNCRDFVYRVFRSLEFRFGGR